MGHFTGVLCSEIGALDFFGGMVPDSRPVSGRGGEIKAGPQGVAGGPPSLDFHGTKLT
jgi:hypothetical protein